MCDNKPDLAQSWKGTSLNDIYKDQGPWSFNVTPVSPSKYHKVLYQVPFSLQEGPRPYNSSEPKHWDDDHVRMPFSPKSLFVVNRNGEDIVRPRWDVITESLLRPISDSAELETAIGLYNTQLPKFAALHRFFNEVLEEEETQHFFSEILPGIVRLALQLPSLMPGSLPLLRKNHCRSVSLSQMQVASLLANAFLCTFVWRKDTALSFPAINFVRLFVADDKLRNRSCVGEKLKCICHYFRRVLTKAPVGCITFERKFVHRSQMPRWDNAEYNLGNTKIHITSEGVIEDASGLLQVDFANKRIGGGVIGYGCVQEEIRFVICPELIVSRLFVEELGDHEAIEIRGIERYSNYSGYGETFKWDGNCDDQTPFDEYGRRRTNLVVIDATHFNKPKDQFYPSSILREVNKAYVGFSSRERNNIAPVASGNWGCGAFRGDPYLKALIQLMACNAAARDLVYFSFGDATLRDQFYNMHSFLANNRIKICQLWRYLCRFCTLDLPAHQLYSFVQQSHFDAKSQPSIKSFFFCGAKKQQNSTESSSNDASNHEELPIQVTPKTIKERSPTKKNKNKTANSDEPIDIGDFFDVSFSKQSSSSETEYSFLAEIDKLGKDSLAKTDLEAQQITDKSDCVVEMVDVEETTRPVVEEKKRKITDYFCNITKST